MRNINFYMRKLAVRQKVCIFAELKTTIHMIKAKPFIKWVGGKSQLIEQLDALLPADFGNWENATLSES